MELVLIRTGLFIKYHKHCFLYGKSESNNYTVTIRKVNQQSILRLSDEYFKFSHFITSIKNETIF